MSGFLFLDDQQAELLAGGGLDLTMISVLKNRTRIRQSNRAINAAVGVAYKASAVVNASAIENLQSNSVG